MKFPTALLGCLLLMAGCATLKEDPQPNVMESKAKETAKTSGYQAPKPAAERKIEGKWTVVTFGGTGIATFGPQEYVFDMASAKPAKGKWTSTGNTLTMSNEGEAAQTLDLEWNGNDVLYLKKGKMVLMGLSHEGFNIDPGRFSVSVNGKAH